MSIWEDCDLTVFSPVSFLGQIQYGKILVALPALKLAASKVAVKFLFGGRVTCRKATSTILAR
jgi:hypothetical protein